MCKFDLRNVNSDFYNSNFSPLKNKFTQIYLKCKSQNQANNKETLIKHKEKPQIISQTFGELLNLLDFVFCLTIT